MKEFISYYYTYKVVLCKLTIRATSLPYTEIVTYRHIINHLFPVYIKYYAHLCNNYIVKINYGIVIPIEFLLLTYILNKCIIIISSSQYLVKIDSYLSILSVQTVGVPQRFVGFYLVLFFFFYITSNGNDQPLGPDPPHMGYPTSNPRPPILIGVIFMVKMRVLIFFYVVFILIHIICSYLHIIIIYLMFGMHKPRRFFY